jgi:membrane glycosyltransferase
LTGEDYRAPKRWSRTVIFSRVGLALATLASTYLATTAFSHVVFQAGVNPLTVLLCVLFAILFLWVAQGFWTATIGVLQMLRHSPHAIFPAESVRLPRMKPADLPRTAVLMPIYNEDPKRVYAGLESMIRSVKRTGYSEAFDYYILSDTTDPEVWLAEETQLAAMLETLGAEAHIFYRRRHRNVARKSGNIEDFCERFGSDYTFMLTLDADSVMEGEVMVEMVHRAAAEQDIGILQVPPQPVNRTSFFARCQQFAASLYGEVFNVGFGSWTHLDGNYYGHNALIRVRPFIDHCGLPILPGRSPLGGEILSHDFVEAALIRKAGYKVRIAYDLDGSYEECPTTLTDYAIRDQRWCQGNMQHIRLVFTRGYHIMSRLHLAMGVMSYLASPLWLLFMLTGFISVFFAGEAEADTILPITPGAIGLILFTVVMLMLLIPKLYAICLVLQRHDEMQAHGGELQVVIGSLIELAVSVLIAPIMMVYHTTFVINTLLGRSVKWSAQQRGETEVGWADAARDFWKMTVGGIIAAGLVLWLTPSLFVWALPVLAGLILAIPTAVLLSSTRVGEWLRKHRLLIIPQESYIPPALQRFNTALKRTQAAADAVADIHPMRRVLADPAFYRFHVAVLQSNREPFETDVNIAAAVEEAKQQGLENLERKEQVAILSNPHALADLHQHVWEHWDESELSRGTSDADDEAPMPQTAGLMPA